MAPRSPGLLWLFTATANLKCTGLTRIWVNSKALTGMSSRPLLGQLVNFGPTLWILPCPCLQSLPGPRAEAGRGWLLHGQVGLVMGRKVIYAPPCIFT